jgi:hypothetical protein
MYNPQAYRKFENPDGLVADGIKARKIYYDSIGLSYKPVGRGIMYSQPRQAFGVALSQRIGYALTAKVLEKDRTTLNHYGKCHEMNLESWDGYAEVYDNAKYVVDTLFDGTAKTDRIDFINAQVSELLREKFLIQNSFYEQLQIQNHQHSGEAVR